MSHDPALQNPRCLSTSRGRPAAEQEEEGANACSAPAHARARLRTHSQQQVSAHAEKRILAVDQARFSFCCTALRLPLYGSFDGSHDCGVGWLWLCVCEALGVRHAMQCNAVGRAGR